MKSIRSLLARLKPSPWMVRLCYLCRMPADGYLCGDCAGDLPYIQHACVRCALPLPHAGVCGVCQQQPPAYDRALSVFRFEQPVAYLIHQLKYHQALSVAGAMAVYLGEAVERAGGPLPEVLIPVPLHPRRLRKRGFNQALEIGRPLAKRWRRPLEKNLCRRILDTQTQTGLSREQRLRNLRDAFECAPSAGRYRHAAIIDDVMTTGATLQCLALVLKKAGIERVDVWVCARADRPGV